MTTRVFVISDLHLGGEEGFQMCSEKGRQRLEEFLRWVGTQRADSRATRLVIAGDIVDFAIVGPGPVIKVLAGPMAVLNSLLAFLQPFIKDQLQNSLSPWVEQVAPKVIAAALALPQLPPSTTITLRSLKIDGSGITFQPVLGTIGSGLSTFKPVPLSP